MDYELDLNAERCIYSEPGRQYVIAIKDGHHYDGEPVKISVHGDKVDLYKSGDTLTFSAETSRPYKSRSTLSHDYTGLADLSFISNFPTLAKQISYGWTASGTSEGVYPE